MPSQRRLFEKNGQSESSWGHRGRKHGEGDEPLGPAVSLTLVELQPEVDEGTEGRDHGECEYNVIWKQKKIILELCLLSGLP